MLHIYLKYASYWLHIGSKYGYEGDLTTLLSPYNSNPGCSLSLFEELFGLIFLFHLPLHIFLLLCKVCNGQCSALDESKNKSKSMTLVMCEGRK